MLKVALNTKNQSINQLILSLFIVVILILLLYLCTIIIHLLYENKDILVQEQAFC